MTNLTYAPASCELLKFGRFSCVKGRRRIITGLLFLAHGTVKLFQWPCFNMFKDRVPLVSLISIGDVLKVVGCVLIVVGLFTRPVAFVMSGMMAFAYSLSQAPVSFYPTLKGGELAIL